MPRTPLEKLKSERRQLCREFTKTYNNASEYFTQPILSNEDISLLKTTAAALNDQFQECHDLGKDIGSVALDEIKDEDKLDAFFDEVNKVTNAN